GRSECPWPSPPRSLPRSTPLRRERPPTLPPVLHGPWPPPRLVQRARATGRRVSRDPSVAPGRSGAEGDRPARVASDLFFLHEFQGGGEWQPELRVGELPAGRGLDPAEPVG